MRSAVVCLAKNREIAKEILQNLISGKVQEIFLFVQPGKDEEIFSFEGLKQIVPEPAASTGGAAVAGGTIGALLAAPTLAVPFVGPFIFTVTLPITTTLGAAAGAAAGAIKGTADSVEAADVAGSERETRRLEDLGMPETEIPRYQSALSQGRYLIAVRSANQDILDRAEMIFQSNEGENISFF